MTRLLVDGQLHPNAVRLDCIRETDVKNPLIKRQIFSLGSASRLMYFETWRGTNKVHKMAVWDRRTWDWLFVPSDIEQMNVEDKAILDEYAEYVGIPYIED